MPQKAMAPNIVIPRQLFHEYTCSLTFHSCLTGKRDEVGCVGLIVRSDYIAFFLSAISEAATHGNMNGLAETKRSINHMMEKPSATRILCRGE